ncbi:NAD(P)H-dependent oxidoreductase [Gloeobacter morelensis]|uniref:NAD(P)-dependent oxidoreductase n=1 Tax=Gloeobacter morelensis MG652769 TaxID=2781736 RepID=A0ABY3PS53_9CYAN|nr:Gfo/Idh/MocA family oxidoreductase [Gloeobacter morelensis]UFP96566.1 NAD(P)-dependent oxidoreductase [Gloeobacter morelensis MG652769]
MIIIDSMLERRQSEGRPIRVGMVGAGFAGRGLAMQMVTSIVGMQLVAIANRTLDGAKRAYREAGVEQVRTVETTGQLETAVAEGHYAVTDDPFLLCEAVNIDAIVEITGEVEFGARVILKAIEHGKHVILMNAELDATLGPVLKAYADRAGVVFTNADGDQPGVIMNLFRYVRTLGFKPLLCGNIKSLLDCRRTPETQKAWAEANFQRTKMVTSFADGTKIAMEMCTVANATGMGVGKRGMYGPTAGHVDEAPGLFDLDELMRGGLVDYLLGAQPSFGVFVLGYSENPLKQRYMRFYKMGDGPVYTFYTPFHLSPLEAPLTVARAVLLGDAAVVPIGEPVCEVIAQAKRPLGAGETLDGIGGFTCYGMLENARTARAENLLPMGLTDGCRLLRDIAIDQPITFADVELPANRLSDRLYREQSVALAARRTLQPAE